MNLIHAIELALAGAAGFLLWQFGKAWKRGRESDAAFRRARGW